MSNENTAEKPSINSVLKESLGNVNIAGSDVAAAVKQDNMVVVDYKMVTFSLAGKDYAIDIMKVKEIAKAGRFTYVPNALPFVLGVYNLRGEIIPIIDLRLFFNIEMPEREYDALENMLIVSIGELTFGVVVDEIDKVVGIQKSSINPPHPLFGDINIKYIQGVVEVNNRLYILLDIEKIFGSKADNKSSENAVVREMSARIANSSGAASGKKQGAKAAAPAAPKVEKVDYSFVVDSLASMRKFSASALNDKWMQVRYKEWEQERGKNKTQLQNPADADLFLKKFYSPFSGTWWDKTYADSIFKALPDNAAKQIVVWNPGCGKGAETYSLACILKKRYPESKIRIYAHEVDLLSISNAPLLAVPGEVANDWYAPYITKKANGDFTFTQEIRDSIMFEYHDCANTNNLPSCDIIFARDVLSFLPESSQQTIVADFSEKLKGNGIVFLGQNESLEENPNWSAKTVGTVTIFGKK
ncbi:CheR family methyltransferase [uncultured Treponema sp.]|uniref:CheR family methyltransferase n=1 Tax=uncultured Treponema sp. TaxID=162155 RepID=UPI0025CD9356|nr:CheR family methyltransferase [uncultured Treponema sp.]